MHAAQHVVINPADLGGLLKFLIRQAIRGMANAPQQLGMRPLQGLLTHCLPGTLAVMPEGRLIRVGVVGVTDRPRAFFALGHFIDLLVDTDTGRLVIEAEKPTVIGGDICQVEIACIGRQIRFPQALFAARQGNPQQAVHLLARLHRCNTMSAAPQASRQGNIQPHRLKMGQRFLTLPGLPRVSTVDHFFDHLCSAHHRHHSTQGRYKERGSIEHIEANALPVRQALLPGRFINLGTGHRQVAGIGLEPLQVLVLPIAE
ncbi:hypothetical protein D3C80_638480 [compost metagenome]